MLYSTAITALEAGGEGDRRGVSEWLAELEVDGVVGRKREKQPTNLLTDLRYNVKDVTEGSFNPFSTGTHF